MLGIALLSMTSRIASRRYPFRLQGLIYCPAIIDLAFRFPPPLIGSPRSIRSQNPFLVTNALVSWADKALKSVLGWVPHAWTNLRKILQHFPTITVFIQGFFVIFKKEKEKKRKKNPQHWSPIKSESDDKMSLTKNIAAGRARQQDQIPSALCARIWRLTRLTRA